MFLTSRRLGLLACTRSKPTATLEITPSAKSEKEPVATEQLFAVLGRVIGKRGLLSLELMSTYGEGIRYLVRARPWDIVTIQRHVASYLPEAKLHTFETHTSLNLESDLPNCVLEVRQASHYVRY